MSLADKAKAARAVADASLDPADHALAAALEGALDAEAREQLRELEPEPADPDSFPDPPVKNILIPKPASEN